MPSFQYSAIDTGGREKTGRVTAETADDARRRLSGAGLLVTGLDAVVAPASAVGKGPGRRRMAFGRVVGEEELTTFTRRLAILTGAGLPLLRALEVLARQERNLRFKDVIERIASEVRSGGRFSDGLAASPRIFDRLYTNMVRAGEAGGVLEVVLGRLAGFREKSLRTRGKVKSAMVYPLVVITVAVSIVLLLMVVVVPKFQVIFNDMLEGAPLPAPTQLVISVSEFISSNVVVTVVLVALAVAGLRFFKGTRSGARVFDRCALLLPGFGDLARKANVARVSRTLATLLTSGVPILQAVTITRETTGNAFFADALGRMHDAVRDGEPVAAPMAREKVFPDMVTSMVEVGEETGDLAGMLNRVADTYDEDVDNAVAGITSIIEPVMIVFLALVVGFIVIALFLPIVEIIRQLTG